MVLGRRKRTQQQDLFITPDSLPKSNDHVFYKNLNELLDAQWFDTWIENLCLRSFLGIPLTENTPDRSSLTVIRERLPASVHEAVFEWVLRIASDKKLLQPTAVAVDSTQLAEHTDFKPSFQSRSSLKGRSSRDIEAYRAASSAGC